VSKSRPGGEYDVRLAEMAGHQTEMMTAMKAHIESDSKAFEINAESIKSLIGEVAKINTAIQALLETKAAAWGAWKATAIISAGLVAVAGLYIAYENLVRATITH